jgi:phospholipid transport system substrate-binding protein
MGSKEESVMKVKIMVWGLICCLWTAVALAQDPPPLVMLKQTSDQMLNALKANKSSMQSNPNTVYHIVNTILLPHVDLETMGRSVVGRNYWMQATPAQREQFKRLFTRQVTHTYAAALESYQNEQIKFYPIRGYNPSAQRLQVQSMIVRSNGQNIPLNYRLINSGGQWKVYDFTVEGVSIVQSYSAQFSDDLQRGGLPALLTKMQQRYG